MMNVRCCPLRAVSIRDTARRQQVAVGAGNDERPLAGGAGKGEAHDDVLASAGRRIDAEAKLLEREEVVRHVPPVQARQPRQVHDRFGGLAHVVDVHCVFVVRRRVAAVQRVDAIRVLAGTTRSIDRSCPRRRSDHRRRR